MTKKPQTMMSSVERSNELREKLMRQYIHPTDLFRKHTHLYSMFDENGIPTHDVSGNELGKSVIKKLNKDWLKQKKLYEESVKL